MPLIVPEATTNSADPTEEWMRKLVGKKIADEASSETVFCKRDLPQDCRVIKPGTMVTRDFREGRLNVHVDDGGTVSHVYYG